MTDMSDNANLYARLAAGFDRGADFLELPDGTRYTYGDAERASAQVAHALRALGLKAGDCAAVVAEKSVALVWLYLGCLRAGVIYQPISDELFWAEKGNGAFIDTPNARSRRLRVSGRKDPARGLIGTGIPHIGKGDHPAYFAKLAAVTERTAFTRTFTLPELVRRIERAAAPAALGMWSAP